MRNGRCNNAHCIACAEQSVEFGKALDAKFCLDFRRIFIRKVEKADNLPMIVELTALSVQYFPRWPTPIAYFFLFNVHLGGKSNCRRPNFAGEKSRHFCFFENKPRSHPFTHGWPTKKVRG